MDTHTHADTDTTHTRTHTHAHTHTPTLLHRPLLQGAGHQGVARCQEA